jgi:arsenate reductase|tara:strand:- start:1329 stop:1664 length:336 start_codon:yes stop_codon:yes gene_type:complete
LAVAEELGVEVDVVLYMKEPPDEALLARIAAGLDGPVEDLVRKDSQFSKLDLLEEDYVGNPGAVVELLARRRALLQRPVLVRGELSGDGPLVACVGRPKARLYEFIGGSAG